jgi:hypothetical protein
MSSRLPLAAAQAKQFVELLPELGWDLTAAYAKVAGLDPKHVGTRKAAAAFTSRPDVALMIRRRWSIAPDSKVTQEEAQALLRGLIYADPGDYMVAGDGVMPGRWLNVAEFKALPKAVRCAVQSFEVLPNGEVRVTLPSRLDAIKLICTIGGLMGGEKERDAAEMAGALIDAVIAASQRAQQRIVEAGKSHTAKQLQLPGPSE